MKTKQKITDIKQIYEYDLDGDGVVSDAELANMKEIKENRKNFARTLLNLEWQGIL